MPLPIQRNVGNHIYRGYPTVPFLTKVWGLDVRNLPSRAKSTLPRTVRRYMVAYDMVCHTLDMASGPKPSKAATVTADSMWRQMEVGTFGLLQDPAGSWERVDNYGENPLAWQKVLVLFQVRKGQTPGAFGAHQIADPCRSGRRRGLSHDESVFAELLMLALSSGVRSWVSGIVIHDLSVTFWYADRQGVVISLPFNSDAKPNLLWLASVAIGSSTRKGLGICPFLTFEQQMPTCIAEADIDFRYSEFKIPGLVDAEGVEIRELMRFGQSSWDWPDVAVGQLVGRGTVVLPVRATGLFSKRAFGEERDSVLKFAWAAHDAPVEDAVVRVIRQRLAESRSDMLNHVTELKCSVTKTIAEMSLPRVALNITEDLRVLRIQVLRRYLPLDHVSSVDDFKTVFVDAVRAHYWVYETSGILHRDISHDNIMLRTINGEQRGVLVDWDLAQKPSRRGRRPAMRTGSVPFMSPDFYAPWWQGEHFYRHDLEAFFYLFVWFCVCFVPAAHGFNTSRLANWYYDHEAGHAEGKRFVSDDYDRLKALADLEYVPLLGEWGVKLMRFFKRSLGKWYSNLNALHRIASGEQFDDFRNGEIAEVDIRNYIVRYRAKREATITYDGFMACLELRGI